jgi:hypothetical protein
MRVNITSCAHVIDGPCSPDFQPLEITPVWFTRHCQLGSFPSHWVENSDSLALDLDSMATSEKGRACLNEFVPQELRTWCTTFVSDKCAVRYVDGMLMCQLAEANGSSILKVDLWDSNLIGALTRCQSDRRFRDVFLNLSYIR